MAQLQDVLRQNSDFYELQITATQSNIPGRVFFSDLLFFLSNIEDSVLCHPDIPIDIKQYYLQLHVVLPVLSSSQELYQECPQRKITSPKQPLAKSKPNIRRHLTQKTQSIIRTTLENIQQ